MPESRKKVYELRCLPEVPEEYAFLCDIKKKLEETGVGGVLVSLILDIGSSQADAVNLLSNIPQASEIIPDINKMFENFKHDLITTILKTVDIDVPVCYSSHDRECLTVRVKALPKNKPQLFTSELVYIDEDGNYIIVYT